MRTLIEPLLAHLDDFSLVVLNGTCKHFYSLFEQEEFMQRLCAVRKRKSCTWSEFCKNLRTEFVKITYLEASSRRDVRDLVKNKRFQACIAAGINSEVIPEIDHIYLDEVLCPELLNHPLIVAQFLLHKPRRKLSIFPDNRTINNVQSIAHCSEDVLKLLFDFYAVTLQDCLRLEDAYSLVETVLKFSNSYALKKIRFTAQRDVNGLAYLELLDSYGYVIVEVDYLALDDKAQVLVKFLEEKEKYSFARLLQDGRDSLLETRIRYGTKKIDREVVNQIVKEYDERFCELFLDCSQIDSTHFVRCLIEADYRKLLYRYLYLTQENSEFDTDHLIIFLLENSFKDEFLLARWLLNHKMVTDPATLKLAISKGKKNLSLLILNYGMPVNEELLRLPYEKEMLPVYLHIKEKVK